MTKTSRQVPLIKRSLADRLEYAVLEMVVEVHGGQQQSYQGEWEARVRECVPELEPSALLSTFIRLHKMGVLRLSKPDATRRAAQEYVLGKTDDSRFFCHGRFNTDVTDEGRIYWDGLKDRRSGKG